jgi:DNA repair protein RadC
MKSKANIWQVSEISLRYEQRVKLEDSPTIHTSRDAWQVFYDHWTDDLELLESFNVLFLNRANKVKGMFQASRGGVAGTVVDAKIIYGAAVKAMASSIIVAHNHPSGNLRPSHADEVLTTRLKNAGKALDIQFLDHLILTPDGRYTSFADEGKL